MHRYEYRVVPAPARGDKAKGAKTAADRFAATLMAVMNDLGRDGWDYVRADTLPCEERVGLTGKSSSFMHMLVFRRPLAERAEADVDSASLRAAILGPHPDGAVPRVTPFAKPVIVPAAPATARSPSPGGD